MTKPSLTSRARAQLATFTPTAHTDGQSPIGPIFNDAVKVFDLAAGRPGEAAAYFARTGQSFGGTRSKYWEMVGQLPENASLKCGQAAAKLDETFGAGKWRSFFSATFENHPLLARVKLANALVQNAPKVRASLGLAPAPTAQASASPMTPKLHVAAKPAAAPVTPPTRPDFSHLHGVARTRAAMEWQTTGKVPAWSIPPAAPKLDALGRPITGFARARSAFEQQTKAKQKK